MELLERDDVLGAITGYAAEARTGESRLVLVAGEAGVGKTSLLDAARQELDDARWLWGVCDGSFTPQPLGPLYDVADQLGEPLASAAHDGLARDRLFRLVLEQLAAYDGLTVLAVEDVHWADEATLDLLRFLGKRLRDSRVLVLLTYRDDGLARDHPLRTTLGELTSQRSTRRIGLPPLTKAAVDELAQRAGVDPVGLHRLTGGNPYFVAQVLDAGEAVVPTSAGDAVLARAARLDAAARDVLDAAAVIGARVELDLLRQVSRADDDDVDACLTTGLLDSDATAFRWRHEIARLAVESDLPAHRRTDLHARALAALDQAGETDDARLAHHAEACGDGPAVLRHAVPAGRRAHALGAHREAAAQLERALRYAAGLPAGERATLWLELADADSLLDRWEQAAEAREQALELWREVGDQLRVGDTMRLLARAYWRLCRGDEDKALSAQALEVLEALPPSRELAWATANLATMQMMAGDPEGITTARRAQALARRLGEAGVLSDALNTEGVLLAAGGGDGIPALRQSLEIALSAELAEQSGRAYSNLHEIYIAQHRIGEAERIYLEGLANAEERDLPVYAACLHGAHTCTLSQAGRWDEGVVVARSVLDRVELSPVNRINALCGLTEIQLRRGDPAAAASIAELAGLVASADDPPVTAGQLQLECEQAWLAGDLDAARARAAAAAALMHTCDIWVQGAIAGWLRRLGLPVPDLPRLPEPYAAALAGDWRGAAAQWHELGVPYEEALTLLDSGDEAALRDAARILDDLGAVATLALAQAEMRRLGVRVIPRGRRASTKADPFGLTPREREVLDQLRTGATNAQIAERLVLSEKTVDHHVSAVLAKLGVASRRDASRLAEAAAAT